MATKKVRAKKAGEKKASTPESSLKEVTAVYTGDSANYHIYQAVDTDGVVGTLYFTKESTPPKNIVMELLVPSDKNWRKLVEKLQANAREGSKAHDRLTSILAS